jgi:HAD superfamily hydrolase (TIGR01549 family)
MPIALKAVLLDLDELPYAQIRQTVSDGARGMVQGAFGCRETDPEFEPLRQELLDLYRIHLADNSRLFDGMAELLEFIEAQGLAWGVVTNKPSVYAEPLLTALNLRARCATLVCPDHVQHRKPHPEPLYLACRQIGCSSAEAIYLGDHRRDIEAGHNASMNTVACAFGYIHSGDPCENWGADHVVQRPQDVIAILQQRLP